MGEEIVRLRLGHFWRLCDVVFFGVLEGEICKQFFPTSRLSLLYGSVVAHNKTGLFDVLVKVFFQCFVLLMNLHFPSVLLRNVFFIWCCNKCIIFLVLLRN
jgi:hypothetical protein